MNRFSPEISHIGKYLKENDWKHELKIGDEVDGFDKAKVWYPSTILNFKQHTQSNGRLWTLVRVGFRVFTPSGQKTDDEGKKYIGWSRRFDEWIPLWSPRIAKLHSYTWRKYYKGLRRARALIDDSTDSKINENSSQTYAVLRPRLNKSSLLIECLNLFGSEGGYDKILSLLINENSPKLELLHELLS